ncbi:hypothetical protein BC829DRAFT_412821 [Chytridium lagenaria]|nr:hypothetical protein BC829DRAFT_412821 [Chytridium lagenaria]
MHFKAILASTLKCTLVGSILISQSVNPISAIAVYRRAENPASTVAVQINSPSETPASVPQDISEPAQFSRHADDAAGPEDAQAAQIFNDPRKKATPLLNLRRRVTLPLSLKRKTRMPLKFLRTAQRRRTLLKSSHLLMSSCRRTRQLLPTLKIMQMLRTWKLRDPNTTVVAARGGGKRIAVLRDRLKMGGKKGSKKAYGLTYFHKKTNYPAGSAVTTPEEDITYKKVTLLATLGLWVQVEGEFRLLADKRKRRSRRKSGFTTRRSILI